MTSFLPTLLRCVAAITIFWGCVSTAVPARLAATATKPVPVANLDKDRYLGTWHQLALIPASFQKQCAKNTTATYSQVDDGPDGEPWLKVVNECRKEDGSLSRAEARARQNKELGLASTLQVTFVKFIKWIWAFAGDYWVIYIDDDYSVALVGHPEYKFGWILSRTPTLTKERYKELAAELVKQGYDSCAFFMSTTPSQEFPQQVTLCDFLGLSNLGLSDLGLSNLGSSDLGLGDLGLGDLGSSDFGSSDLGHGG